MEFCNERNRSSFRKIVRFFIKGSSTIDSDPQGILLQMKIDKGQFSFHRKKTVLAFLVPTDNRLF